MNESEKSVATPIQGGGGTLPYNLILRALHEGVHIYDRHGKIIDTNESAERILSLSRDQQLGLTYVDPAWKIIRVDGSDFSPEEFPVHRTLATGERVSNVVMGVVLPSTETRWILVNSEPVRSAPGDDFEFIVVSFNDITQQKAVEDRQREALRIAQRAQDYSSVLSTIEEGVLIYSREGVVADCNDVALDLLQLQRNETIGASYSEMSRRVLQSGEQSQTEDSVIQVALMQKKATTGKLVQLDLENELYRWVTVNAVPILDEVTGDVDRVIVVFRNVTDLMDGAEKLRVALGAAEAANSAKNDFLAVISHELRTPMNAVLGAAQMLAHTELNENQRSSLAMLEDSGRNMMVLLNDLIDMSSIDGDRVQLEPQSVDVRKALRTAHNMWLHEAEQANLRLDLEIDGDLGPMRMIDPGRLQQVLFNLLGNALKFTSHGWVKIQARSLCAADGRDQIEFSVSDSGRGIPPEKQHSVFDVFERVDLSSTRQAGGVGIGLYIARRLVELMGGEIKLESEEAVGSTFTFTIDAPIADSSTASSHPDAGGSEDVRLRLLCVDDNQRNLHIIATLLRSAGHSVLTCTSGREALTLARRVAFDVVVLDMVMPDMDGLEVLRQLRADGSANQATPAIACTANVLRSEINYYLEQGLTDVVPKPIEVATLFGAVRRAYLSRQADIAKV